MIRVVCTACHSASEVFDEAAGSQAVCPFCSNVFDVPVATSAVSADPVDNPYAAPAVMAPSRRVPLTSAPIEWGQLDPRVCCRIAAELYRRHAGILLSAHCLFFGVMIGSSWLLQSLVDRGLVDLAGLLQFGIIAANLYLNIGLSLLGLRLARNEPTQMNVLFTGGSRLLRLLVFSILFGLLIVVGCVGFIVPGIYFAARFWAGGMFIIDQNCSAFEAFGLASRFSEGNRLASLMLGLISLGVGVCGASLFGIGLIFVGPFLTLIWVVAYLMLTRQPLQRPLAAGHAT